MTWQATIPKMITLGGLPVVIVLVPDLQLDGKSAHGTWDSNHSRIELNQGLPTKEFAITIFLHELLHALYWFFDMSSKAGEETVVSNLSGGLWMVFSNNPELVTWIHGEIDDST